MRAHQERLFLYDKFHLLFRDKNSQALRRYFRAVFARLIFILIVYDNK